MEKDIKELESEYRSVIKQAQIFCDEFTHNITKQLKDNNIELGFPVISRVKTWDSLKEKIGRLKRNFSSVMEFQDLIGTRIILLFPDDVNNVCKILSNSFKVIRYYDATERLKEDQFGYTSIHYIVKIPQPWFEIPIFTGLPNFQIEVQIRTLAQHLWAEVSHTLQYKSEESIPTQLRRNIFRLSALLEIIDEEIDRALSSRDEYRNELQASTDDNTELNSDSLEIILSDVFPKHKDENEYYSELIRELKACDIDTPIKFKAFINRNKTTLLAEDSMIVREKGRKDHYLSENEKRRVKESGVYFTHTGLVRNALDKEFEGSWREAL